MTVEYCGVPSWCSQLKQPILPLDKSVSHSFEAVGRHFCSFQRLRRSSADPFLPRCCNLGRSRDLIDTLWQGKVVRLDPVSQGLSFGLWSAVAAILSRKVLPGSFRWVGGSFSRLAESCWLYIYIFINLYMCIWILYIYIYYTVGPVGPGLSRGRFSFFVVPLRCVDRYKEWRLLCTQEQQSIKQTIWRSMELLQRFGPFTADVAPMDYPCGNSRLTIAKENAICSEEECVQRAAAPWRTPQVSHGMVSCVWWIPPAEVYIWPVSCLQIRSSLVSTQHRVASHSGKNVHAGCGCPSLERSASWLVNSLSTCPVLPVPFWGHMEAPDEIRFMALSVRLVSLI